MAWVLLTGIWEISEREENMSESIQMTFDEFLSTPKIEKRGRKGKEKLSSEDLFNKVKVRMVMKIYGVPCAKALEIVARRAAGSENRAERGGKEEEAIFIAPADVRKMRLHFDPLYLDEFDDDEL